AWNLSFQGDRFIAYTHVSKTATTSVRLLVMNELNPDGCIINDGVCGLLDTIGHKISDIASGRLPNMLLPELSENKSDNLPGNSH
ncbi:hypothetical protein, partial [Trichlorobacter lovleyi]|uniref:hypothetical protein n=1 Tax=Trichlorobacter lovleyi TaxID=313985 RepID=UPI0023F42252